MRRLLAAVVALCFTATASFALPIWTGSFTLTTNGGNGAVLDLNGGSPGAFDPAFTMVGSNQGSFAFVLTSYTADAPPPPPPFWNVKFEWTYSTNDSGGSSFDPFGYIVNGVPTQVSANGVGPGAANVQSGILSFLVPAGANFGWYIASDNLFGAATATVFATITAVPVPAALPLLLGGLAALGFVARRRRREAA